MRPPSVFVRPLAPAEGQRLKRLSKQAKHSSTRQRAACGCRKLGSGESAA
jgi:hypothetical protein